MKFKIQKRLAAQIMGCSKKRIKLDINRLEDIKEAITKSDIKSLIKDNAIIVKPIKGISKVRSRKIKIQKRKGKRKGKGSRKGKKTARLARKTEWINKIRAQRGLLKELLENNLIGASSHRALYQKAKGGFFRSRRHIKLYIGENGLIKKS